jgi:hypothetical protein
MPTIMAGLDNVDPAYACQLPVSFAMPPVEHTTIPPNSPMPKQHPRAD